MRYKKVSAKPGLLLTATVKVVSVSKAVLIGFLIIIFLLLIGNQALAQAFQFKLEPMPPGWIAITDQGQAYPGNVLQIHGGDWGKSLGGGGVVIDVQAWDKQMFQSFQHFKDYAMNADYGYNAQPVVEQVIFNGYPAFRNIVISPVRIYEWYYFQAGEHYIMIYSDITDAQALNTDRWKREQEQVLKGLSFPGSPPPSATAPGSVQSRPCKAVIHLPSDLKPGEILSPSYTITGQDGSAPIGDIYPVLYINGVQTHSVVWDGNEAEIELQVSCQGHPLAATAIMPAYGTLPPPDGTTSPDDSDIFFPPPDSTPDGLGKIPLPENAAQAMAGILIPGIISIILGILGQSGAAGSVGGGSAAAGAGSAPSGGGPYLFDDGREYYEGRNYTIQVGDSCTEYRVVDGDLVPVRELRSGEAYIDVDGNPKIWIGGQSWHEEDWRRQAATNRGYKAAHDADWAVESTRLNPDMVASQQQYELEKAATDKEIGEQRDKVRELLRESIRVQQSINELRRDIADSSARFADRVTRTLEATKYVCDKVIDLAAKIPGPKGVAFKGIRKAYRATAAMAGGVGQGMATGNWTDSMIDATGEAVGNLIEDSIQTDRYKKGFEVFRGGAGEAWRQGREAYRKGESVLGSATTGFVEGAASEASKKAKEALKEFAPGSQYAYTIGESAFKAGYKEYKKSGDVGAVMRAAGSGYVDGAIDAAVEFGIGNIFDNLIPETGAVDEKTIQSHMEDYQTAQDTFKELGFADFADYSGTWADKMEGEWRPDFIYDQVREEAKKLATKSTQNVAKGKAFDHELYK